MEERTRVRRGVLVLAAIVFVAGLAGCSPLVRGYAAGIPVAVPNEVGFVSVDGCVEGWSIEERGGYLWLVGSRQELDEAWAATCDEDDFSRPNPAPATFDDDFFEHYDLLMWDMVTSSGGDRYETVGLSTDGDATVVSIRQTQSGSTCDLGSYTSAFALPKREGGYGRALIRVG